ncbi:GDSL-type esterase/lipase family protein [Allocoleopsis franciscana]|uniref:Lysophospholipase L1-like esterase n=1 Tax=Allocoleopsis franciscana PCC 7113 TaxID=1173027 RepID=K9WE82_9CYAN|nr:GDSL-type esterase/lipase family protein [Allocoleopsis franciscana]AFZ18705.1 lysophospholipase L1-like esterase [Allocoleopsis franciscana PCC 7113]
MSDPYLLAASVISVGPICAPPPPALPLRQLDELSTLLVSTTAKLFKSVVTPEIVPLVETVSAEFSPPSPSPAQWRTQPVSQSLTPILIPSEAQEATQQDTTNLPVLPKPQFTALFPTSGSQLYLQRLAALKAGTLFTRLPADSFQSLWAKGTHTKAQPLPSPTHEQWKRLLEQEAKAVAKGQGANRLTILLGDSLTLWFPSQRLPGRQLWLNQGISGENSGQIRRRLSAFAQTQPDTIYVLAGINDLRQGVADDVILNNLRQIVQRLRQNHPRGQVVLQSILPARLNAISNERIRNLNQQIAGIAQREGAGFLNLHPLFTDEQGEMRQELTTDGIHLSHQGYEVWQKGLQYAESALAAKRAERTRKLSDRS